MGDKNIELFIQNTINSYNNKTIFLPWDDIAPECSESRELFGVSIALVKSDILWLPLIIER